MSEKGISLRGPTGRDLILASSVEREGINLRGPTGHALGWRAAVWFGSDSADPKVENYMHFTYELLKIRFDVFAPRSGWHRSRAQIMMKRVQWCSCPFGTQANVEVEYLQQNKKRKASVAAIKSRPTYQVL